MNSFRSLVVLIAAILIAGSTSAVLAADQSSRQKVVFQVSDADPGKWNLTLNNARNVQQDLGAGNVDIEIVAYGPGIGMIKLESPVGNRVREAITSGVKVVACENTMTNMKITKSDMLPSLDYAPAGVVELMKRQREGYAYIRP